MTERIRRQWEALGAVDPYWAVLAEPGKKGGRWSADAFFATGEKEIREVLDRAAALGLAVGSQTALDYGCGVGRLSRALASRFVRVLALDISASMLAEAEKVNGSFANIEFARTSGERLDRVGDRSVDFLYSNIVLQHSPGAVQRRLLGEFCRVLAAGGVLVFQTPSRPDVRTPRGLLHLVLRNRLLNLARGLIHGGERVMEIHTLGREEVLRILDGNGLTVAAVEPDSAAGRAFIGYRYFCFRSPN